MDRGDAGLLDLAEAVTDENLPTNAIRATYRLALLSCILSALTLALVAVGLYLGHRDLQRADSREKRQTQFQITRDFDSPGMRQARSRVAWALMNHETLIPSEAETILDYFETVGFYARNGMLDNDLLWNDLSDAVRCYWYGMRDYAQKERAASHDPTLWENTEWLDSAMAAEEQRHRTLETHLTPARVTDFLRSEISRGQLRELVNPPGRRGPPR